MVKKLFEVKFQSKSDSVIPHSHIWTTRYIVDETEPTHDRIKAAVYEVSDYISLDLAPESIFVEHISECSESEAAELKRRGMLLPL